MQIFDIDSHLVSTYADKYIELFGLNSKMASSLAMMCGGSNKEIYAS